MKRALLIGLLSFGMNAQATSGKDKDNRLTTLKKKSIYYEIKVKIESGEITLKEAQKLWHSKIKHLRKEEGN
jgi:hypothetical protein